MSATVVQYPVAPRAPCTRLADSVAAAKKRSGAHVRAPSERLALVLDMDECLVHSQFQNDVAQYRQSERRPAHVAPYSDSFEIVLDDGERARVNKRPGLDRFLEEAAKHYDVYVFTAGLEAYGKPILDALDPKGTLFAGRFFRASCRPHKGMFLKDLRVVHGRDLSRVVLVDNNPVSFLLQPSNGIPVPSFYDDEADRTLESLSKVLTSLQDVDDVRPRLHQLFRLADLLADHQRVILGQQ
ncbi:unnamed protein product [Hyaloperonospora brassicae]|uniref:FCP1 homology domain-containing protein n=1 Tax=Hyaloperonospora brassicae TaxID=162125 RepID=A0AAV0SV82_HYABA|nr:unnamed protein product [Hyaloperonospora brassicae]